MFRQRFTLFRFFGIPIHVNSNWILLGALLTWSLAKGYFYNTYEDLPDATYWSLGMLSCVGLLCSILLHELAHLVSAQKYGYKIHGVILHVFGGSIETDDTAPSPKAEFIIALAGPIVSLLLTLLFYLLYTASIDQDWPVTTEAMLGFMALVNAMLGLLNLLPVFPLDGAKLLRSLLWFWKGDYQWSTQITSKVGGGFSTLMFVFALMGLLNSQFIFALWLFLIGSFFRGANQWAYQQMLIRKILHGESLHKFLSTDPIVVPYHISLKAFVEDYLEKYQDKVFPVADNSGQLIGSILVRSLQEIPSSEWASRTVKELIQGHDQETTIPLDSDALQAIQRMNRLQINSLVVMDENHIMGVIALKDILSFLALQLGAEQNNIQLDEERFKGL